MIMMCNAPENYQIYKIEKKNTCRLLRTIDAIHTFEKNFNFSIILLVLPISIDMPNKFLEICPL